jgi:putative hydrolase of the HAD superfamily
MPTMRRTKQSTRRVRAISLDVLGTLVELEPPWEHLARELGAGADGRLVDAVRAEMAYYRAHCHEGRDAASLADLRERCAEVLSDALGREVGVEAMMRSIRFRAFDDAAPALAELRALGLRLVCVSNWDSSLPEVLERCGLARLVDGVVSSAGAGARKPDPAIFAPALSLAGCEPGELLHVGDTPEEDVAGARAAGARALLIDREGGGDIASLAEISGRVESMGA